MKLRPFRDRILAEPIEDEAKTKWGPFVPDPAMEKPMEGKVREDDVLAVLE